MSSDKETVKKPIIDDKAWKSMMNMLSGGVAGAVSRTVTSPLERLKVMQQIQTHNSQNYNGMSEPFGRPTSFSLRCCPLFIISFFLLHVF